MIRAGELVLSSIIEGAAARFRDDAAEWRLSIRAAWLLAAIPVGIAFVGLSTLPFPRLYGLLANEDGLVEWAQVVALIVVLAACVSLAIALWRVDRRSLAALYAVAAIGAMFVIGEEISWGQRILGFATPESLEDVNNQGETNIHNVGIVLRIFNLGVLAVCAAAMALPVLRWTRWRNVARSIEGFVLIPPLALIPAFAFPFLYRALRLLFLPEAGARITKYAEFAELSFYVGLVAFVLLARRAVLGRLATEPGDDVGPTEASSD
jgi:hypothetical protein